MKKFKINLPFINTKVLNDGKAAAIIEDDLYLISAESKEMIEKQSQDQGSKKTEGNVQHFSAVPANELNTVTTDYTNVTNFNHSLKAFMFFRQMENARVRIPQIKVCEKKEGHSFAKIDEEWFRISKEAIKELKDHNSDDFVPKYVAVEKSYKLPEFNSISTFYETQPNEVDGLYFHIIDTQMKGDEVYLSGLFIPEYGLKENCNHYV